MRSTTVLLNHGSPVDTLLNVLHDYAPLVCWLAVWGLVFVWAMKQRAA